MNAMTQKIQKFAAFGAMLTLVATAMVLTTLPAAASSHREAPLIMGDPLADNTDVYAFVAPDDSTRTVLVANYIPFETPAGGPNFYRFGDDVLYDIHVDNVGDAKDHLIFRYQFKTTTVNPNTFLYNTGPITFNGTGYTNWNRPQTYNLSFSRDGGASFSVIGSNLLTPPSAVGAVSTPNYEQLSQAAIATNVGGLGIKSFAGQRDDPFFVDLGRVFDLLSVNPAGGTDYVAGLDVNSLVLSVPSSLLKGPNDNVIGVWATASRNSTTVLTPGAKTESGTAVQVSRLGHPLVNEVVIPLGKKDTFNSSQPSGDGQFASFVLNPELARLLVALGIDANAPTTNRTDLATVFLSGVPGLNQPAALTAGTVSEQLRLNMAIAPSTNNPNTVNRMGVLGGQVDGFPNGRRLADDVVDIEIQAVAGVLCQPGGALTGATTVFGTIAQCRASAVNPALGDGVNANDAAFECVFPYVAEPWPGTGARSTFTGCTAAPNPTPTPTPTPIGLPQTGRPHVGPGGSIPAGSMLLALLALTIGGSAAWGARQINRRR